MRRLTPWCALLATAAPLPAQVAVARGEASVVIGPPECRDAAGRSRRKACLEPARAELLAARDAARLAALANYAQGISPAMAAAFDRARSEVAGRLDQVIMAELELERAVDSAAGLLRVVLRVDVSDAGLRRILSAAAATADAEARAGRGLALMVMARAVAAVERPPDPGGAATVERADLVRYDVTTAEDLAATLGSVLARKGITLVDAAFLEEGDAIGLLDDIRFDYAFAPDVRPQTLRRAVAAARAAQVPLLALGTVDVGLPRRDDVTGHVRRSVIVNARVLDVTSPVPRTVATVLPTERSALGLDARASRTAAMTLAATLLGEELVLQLGLKDLQ
ncbi:MAG: hypothetical protein NW201_03445 [Gemmatimonadales bacterium]|nr:hypothetical protein [Gemmatimonadales bacterium]